MLYQLIASFALTVFGVAASNGVYGGGVYNDEYGITNPIYSDLVYGASDWFDHSSTITTTSCTTETSTGTLKQDFTFTLTSEVYETITRTSDVESTLTIETVEPFTSTTTKCKTCTFTTTYLDDLMATPAP